MFLNFSFYKYVQRKKWLQEENINTNSGYIQVIGLRLILNIFPIFIFHIFYSDSVSFFYVQKSKDNKEKCIFPKKDLWWLFLRPLNKTVKIKIEN